MPEPIRVLVVDDDFMVARVHRGYVESVPGFAVAGSASTAAEARAAVTELRPDLVLLDLYLPDCDVEELLASMLDPELGVDVIVLSAANDIDTVRTAFQRGAVHYLIKPFSRRDLEERLTGYRSRRAVVDRAVRQDGTVGQGAVDELFGRRAAPPAHQPLPKGLAAPTLRLVSEELRRRGGDPEPTLSAAECGERVGLARVSARRYLEHLVATGLAEVDHQYGGSGRPQRRYRWTAG